MLSIYSACIWECPQSVRHVSDTDTWSRGECPCFSDYSSQMVRTRFCCVTRSRGCLATISAISSRSFRGYTDPVGFDGEHRINTLDFSLSFDSRSLGSSKKLFDIWVWRITGVASANRAISG